MNSEAYTYIERIRDILIAFYRWLRKININAHQQIARWRNRINTSSQAPRLNEQRAQKTTKSNVDPEQDQTLTELEQYSSNCNPQQRHYPSCDTECKPSSQQKRGSGIIFKTPRTHRNRLALIFRRLSLRNFMDYCVAALNEASSSSCSNKFDFGACSATVWLLGRQYDLPREGTDLIEDIKSRLWITYRRNFPPIDENTRYTTDRGFGCMIRCGQMVLANALLCKSLTRDWRWSAGNLDANPQAYLKILKLFQDREDCPYSIHKIVQTGQKHEGKGIGEWFGPNTIAQALKKLSSSYQREPNFDRELVISIDAALDNIVVIDEIKSKFGGDERSSHTGDSESHKHESYGSWIPGILFIQLRLGLTKINPLYFAALRKTFQFKNSLGIIGGRPNHALYLVGYTEDDIIYLDPHTTQQYVDLDERSPSRGDPGQEVNVTSTCAKTTPNDPGQPYSQLEHLATGGEITTTTSSSSQGASSVSSSTTITSPSNQQSLDETYHCSLPEKMSIDRLDPSLALCFYFNSEQEFDDWCALSQELLVKSEQAPMFEITKSRPCDWSASLSSSTTRTVTKDRNNKSTTSSSSDHDEEFEILT